MIFFSRSSAPPTNTDLRYLGNHTMWNLQENTMFRLLRYGLFIYTVYDKCVYTASPDLNSRHHVLAHGVRPGGLVSWRKRSVSHIVGCVVADAEPHAQTPRGSKCLSSGRQTHERDYHFVCRAGYSQGFHRHCGS